MTPNISLELEQQQRIQNDFAAIEAKLDHETDRFEDGRVDAMSGLEPDIRGWMSELEYRYGWLAGIAQRYDNEIGTAYNEPF